jgi:hypothetical protein
VNDIGIIGRDSELAQLEEALASGRPSLVLIAGGPRMGKSLLLKELRKRSAGHSCRLVPPDVPGDDGAAWLTVDRHSTVDELRRAMDTRGDGQAVEDETTGRTIEVTLIYGYRPEPVVHEWFVRTLLPGLAGAGPPRLIVIAGGDADLAGLESHAGTRIVLGPLPREAVVAELRRIDATIADRLEDRELEAYADAVVDDPSVLDDLRDLLPLTAPSAPRDASPREG